MSIWLMINREMKQTVITVIKNKSKMLVSELKIGLRTHGQYCELTKLLVCVELYIEHFSQSIHLKWRKRNMQNMM